MGSIVLQFICGSIVASSVVLLELTTLRPSSSRSFPLIFEEAKSGSARRTGAELTFLLVALAGVAMVTAILRERKKNYPSPPCWKRGGKASTTPYPKGNDEDKKGEDATQKKNQSKRIERERRA